MVPVVMDCKGSPLLLRGVFSVVQVPPGSFLSGDAAAILRAFICMGVSREMSIAVEPSAPPIPRPEPATEPPGEPHGDG